MRRTACRLASSQNVEGLIERVRNVAKHTRDRVVTHVLSRELCDESLQRIQSTLPLPGTCDVIDINPGICIWSEAVHDLLKPKRHVLVERNRKAFGEFIEPLLNRPASTYRYAPDLATAISPTSDLLSPDITKPVLDARAKGKQIQGIAPVENKSLLVIANLTRSARVAGFSGTEAKRFLSNYYRSLFNSTDYIHQYGLVRILAWMDENSRRSVLPTSVAGQTKQSIQLEAAFDITAVAGPDYYNSTPAQIRRWFAVNEENLEEVRGLEKEKGITTPVHRRMEAPPRPLQSYPPDPAFLAKHRSWFPESQKFVDDLLNVESRLAADDPKWLHSYSRRYKRGQLKPGHPVDNVMSNKTHDQKLYRRLLNQLQTYSNNFHRISAIIGQHRSLWQQIKSEGESDADKQGDRYKTLLSKYDALDKETKALKKDNQIVVYKAVDDYRAYDAKPRAMSWNRRYVQPLLVKPDEFYPRQSLTLLDLTPRPEFLSQINTVDRVICFDYLVTNLIMFRIDNVAQAMHRLLGTGIEEFLSGFPEIHDVGKGGWHNLDDLRLRSLHSQFYVKLAQLYEEWPHRPPIERLITHSRTLFDKPI